MYDYSAHEYKVNTTNVNNGTRTTESFDAVFVCNGHYSRARVPNIAGTRAYQGTQLHSHEYREAAPFAGRTVACIGFGNSAIDIAIELAAVCKQVCVGILLCMEIVFFRRFICVMHTTHTHHVCHTT
jgi:cation diffusion facilitator CzcD-associated flavoprotein CzcO